MNILLKKLYNGQYYPSINNNSNDEKHQEVSAKIEEGLEALKQKLSPEDIIILESVEEYEAEVLDIEMFYAFKEGLRLGIFMVHELLCEK